MRFIYLFILLFVSNFGHAQFGLGAKITKGHIKRLTKYGMFYTCYEKDDAKVFFVPMVHVNTPEFYEKRKTTIDSLRNEGYTIFYEGVRNELDNKEETELYAHKFRRITHLNLLNYYDENNEENRSLKIEGYVFQNDVDFGIDTEKDINCDLSTKEMVLRYEEKFGEVVLTDCDWDTPIGKKYKCSKKDKKGFDYVITTIRNKHLFNEIKNSKAKKIAVVYGKTHTDVVALMLKYDGWKYVRL